MTTIKVWFVLIILVVLQNNVLNSCFETHSFRFSKWISCIIFRYWNSFSARRSIQFRYSIQLRKCFQLWELCFVPPNRTKIGWKGQRLHSHLTRADITFHLSSYFLAEFPLSVSELIYLETGFLFSDVGFRSRQLALWKPKILKFLVMSRTCWSIELVLIISWPVWQPTFFAWKFVQKCYGWILALET